MHSATVTLWASRQVAPTRRVVVADPTGPAWAVGQLCVDLARQFAPRLDTDSRDEFTSLVAALPHLPATGLRHRVQADRVGLRELTHTYDHRRWPRLTADSASCEVYPAAHLWAVLHLAAHLPAGLREELAGNLDGEWAAARRGAGPPYATTPGKAWPLTVPAAQQILGLTAGHYTAASLVTRYRTLLRGAHPDTGGDPGAAAGRLAELTAARDLLLARLAHRSPGRDGRTPPGPAR